MSKELLITENKVLKLIAIQAKKLLLSDNIQDASPEVMDLCELVERYEAIAGEVPPLLKPHGKKPWYVSLDVKGQVAELSEVKALSQSNYER